MQCNAMQIIVTKCYKQLSLANFSILITHISPPQVPSKKLSITTDMSSFVGLGRTQLLKPVIALAGWTFVQEIWMYATRIPAIYKYQVSFEEDKVKEDKHTKIPLWVHRMADNYNNLHEQPQVFYAVALTLTLLGEDHQYTRLAAWGYVGIRVAHSLWHNLVNEPFVRLCMFSSSSVVLAGLTARAASCLFL
ncbi:unnamed protein product [Periconia digitata]|uniref:Uncharacterized protein n=1 Tax=Periconia digitata TaxID=1303443 RepID=A0A9W4UHE1_9PLEO|nr:unnamed protein product [Periconia digitata]